MKVKIVKLEHAPGMLDPVTKRSPFIVVDPTDPTKKTALECADVPDNVHWRRRVLAGELTLVEDAPASAPSAAKPATSSKG